MFAKNQLIGHRGAAGYAPENTIASFNKAYAQGCRFIEFDVMLSADNEAFVFHDDALRRTTNGRGKLTQVSAEYLQSLDAGKWFASQFRDEKIPTLLKAIEWLNEHNVQANIEIKPAQGFEEQTTIAVLMHINRHWPQDKALPLISSFNLDVLKLCHSLSPEMPRALLLKKWQKNWLTIAQEIDCVAVHLDKRDVTQARIKDIKQNGFAVGVYTVNRKRTAIKLFEWGVDALFSDYPDLLT